MFKLLQIASLALVLFACGAENAVTPEVIVAPEMAPATTEEAPAVKDKIEPVVKTQPLNGKEAIANVKEIFA